MSGFTSCGASSCTQVTLAIAPLTPHSAALIYRLATNNRLQGCTACKGGASKASLISGVQSNSESPRTMGQWPTPGSSMYSILYLHRPRGKVLNPIQPYSKCVPWGSGRRPAARCTPVWTGSWRGRSRAPTPPSPRGPPRPTPPTPAPAPTMVCQR